MATQALTPLPIHRLGTEAYNRMVASGALDGEPVELLDGWLVEMSPHSAEHAMAIRRLMRHLAGAEAWPQAQLPLEVPPDAMPEPDLALIEHEPPAGRHPRTALLAVEVAATSHDVDRGVKASLYARAGVPVYWIVDVPGKAVEVRTEPGPDGYRHCEIYRLGAAVPSPAAGVADLDVAVLFADR
ncbi:MAG TPA: Uma2 family endonuclease [Solirubrobacteraceae bacterium]